MSRSRAPQIAVVVLSTVAQVFLISEPSVAQQRDRFKASWSKGHGDCGVGDNGTGFIANFNVDAEVITVGKQRTITFIGAATGPIFKPVTGSVKGDDTFVLEGREEKKDENYTFRGRVRANVIEGTYTRLAHYRGTSRCTAEWTVLIPTGQVSPPTPTTQADDAVIEPALQLPNVVRVSFVQFDAMNVIEDRAGKPMRKIISDYAEGCTGTKGAMIQWVDCAPAFPDGITEKNWPIVAPRNTALVINEARFVSNKNAPLTNPKVRGLADLGGGRVAHFVTAQVTQKGNTLITGRMTADITLPDKVKSYDDLVIKWTVTAGGVTYRAEGSEHPLYVVLGKPRAILGSDGPEPFLTLVDLTVHESEGTSTPRDVVDATFRAFRSRDIHRRDLDVKTGTVRRNGGNNKKLLQYWTPWTVEDQLAGKYEACRCPGMKCADAEEHYTTYSILSSQIGRCGGWAYFFVKTLAVHGLSSEPKVVSDYPGFPKGPAGAEVMLVKRWTFGTPTGSGDFNYESVFEKAGGKVIAGAKAEVKDAAGLAGQGAAVVPNPPGWFMVGGHAIVDYGGKLWDPSYGIGPFDTILDWARAALDGYAKIDHTPTKAVVRFHKGVEAPPPK